MGVDGPRRRAAGGRGRLSGLPGAWLRLLGLTPEPLDVATPLAPDDVHERLSAAAARRKQGPLGVRPVPGRVRLTWQLPKPLNAVEADVYVAPDGAGTRLAGESRPSLLVRVVAFGMPIVLPGAVVAAVAAVMDGAWLTALPPASAVYGVTATLVDGRRGQRRLRDLLTELVTGAR